MSTPTPAQCGHEFDPTAVDADRNDYSEVVDSDGVWRCPHEVDPADNTDGPGVPTVGSTDRCPFHTDPAATDTAAVTEAFRQAVTDPDTPSEFLDAEFGGIDLIYAVLNGASNRPIDLRHARVDGDLRLAHATVQQRLQLDGAHITGELDCQYTQFAEMFSAEGVTVDRGVNFWEATFREPAYLSDATFGDDCRWVETEFRSGVWCNRATFEKLDAHVVTVRDRIDLSEADIDEIQLRRGEIYGRGLFLKTVFDTASFAGTQFHEAVEFNKARLSERLSLKRVTVEGQLSLRKVQTPPTGTTVSLHDAHVADGRLCPAADDPDCGPLVYDLVGATVGDVSLGSDANLDHYRFLDTTFEGFDFAAYRDRLAAVDWQLHRVEWPASNDHSSGDETPSPERVEATFLKAKNGANEVGDTTAAAEFFRREMRARRRTHSERVRHGGGADRLVAASQWVGNALLWGVAGYGERPSRVVATAVTVVAAGAVGFWATLDKPPHGHPVGYLVVSLESFLTLVLAGGAPISNPWVRLFALVEGFAGAFLVALFVFMLTRLIHR